MATKFQRTDRPVWTLIASSFGLGMALLDVTAGIVAVPSIQASLHTDIRGLSWVIDGYTLSFESVAAGGRARRSPRSEAGVLRWPDRVHGGVRCMRASPNVPALIGARIMQGVGAALFMPSSLAILGRAYTEPRQRAQAIGIWSSITAIAGASGPVLGGLLVATLGWRSIFLLNVPLGVLGLAMAVRFIPATSSGKYTERNVKQKDT